MNRKKKKDDNVPEDHNISRKEADSKIKENLKSGSIAFV